MALDTYEGLQQSIADHLDDDLGEQIPDFIRLAEARHSREIRIREMLTRASLSINEGDRYVDLPVDFLDHQYLRIETPTGFDRAYFPDLQEVNTDRITREARKTKARPSMYTIHSQIEFDAPADRDYDAEMFYYVEVPALSDDNTSNVILARAPDVYLYGALLASAPFLVNDERLQTWGELYAQARDALNRSQWESRRGGPLISRVAGSTP
jgi:hypothetical protein